MQVYEIFTRLTLENKASSALAVIARDVLHLEGSLGRLAAKFTSLNATSAAVGGGLAFLGGTAAIGVVAKIAEHGTKLLDQQNKLERLGLSHLEVLKLTEKAYKDIGRAVPTAAADEYLKTVRELRGVTGSWAEAEKLAPSALKFDALIGNLTGGTGGKYTEFYSLMRSSEMKGISTDPKKNQEFVEQAFRMIEAFGGKLTPTDFQTLARRGGTAFINANLGKSLGAIAVMAADLGGPTAGNALMSLYSLSQGSMVLSKQQYATMNQAGLIDPSKVIQQGFGKVQVMPGGVVGGLENQGDLANWAQNIMRPHMMALAKKMASDAGTPELTEAYYENLIAKIIPNRKAAQAASMFSRPSFVHQRMKDLGLAEEAFGEDKAYQSFISQNPVGVKQAFHAQYESMMQAIGAPIMQAAIPVMKAVTDMFTTIGGFANVHPDAMRNLGITVAGIGGLFITLGTGAVVLAMASFIPGGIVTVAVAGIVTVITTLVALNWSTITTSLVSFGSAIDKLTHIGFDWLANKFNALGDAILGLFNKLGSWWSGKATPGSFEGGVFGGGGGITKASWGGGGTFSNSAAAASPQGGWGAGGGSIGGANPILAAIDSATVGDPRTRQILRNIYGGESVHGSHFDSNTHGEDSWGPFQLNRHGGLGAIFEKETGLSVRTQATLGAQAKWVADYVRRHRGPLSQWRGLGHPERFNRLTGGYSGGGAPPNVQPYRKHEKPPIIENTMYLDGEPIHRSIVKRMVKGMTHPTTAPYHDGSRHWTPPDAGLVGV